MMEKIKKEPLWLVAIAMLLVLAGFAFFMIRPALSEVSTQKKEMDNVSRQLNANIVSAEDVARWKEYKDKLVADYQGLVAYYVDKDESLERWIIKEVEKDKYPPSQRFLTELNTEAQRMNQAIYDMLPEYVKKDKWNEMTGPFSPDQEVGWVWENLRDISAHPKEQQIMKILQKRYWVRLRVLNALKGLGLHLLQEVAFNREIFSELGILGTPGKQLDEKYAWRDRYEFTLPDKTGETITFGVWLRIEPADVSRFIASMLDLNRVFVYCPTCREGTPFVKDNQGKEISCEKCKGKFPCPAKSDDPYMFVELAGGRVAVDPGLIPEMRTRPINVYKDDDQDKRRDKVLTAFQTATPRMVKAPVEARLVFRAYDFEPADLKKLLTEVQNKYK